MKKMKFDLSKVNGLLLQHVEKIVLGVVVLIAAYVVYAGYSLPGFEGGKAPDNLKQLSETSRNFIADPVTWDKLKPVRVVEDKLDEQLDKATTPNIDSAYRLPMPWKKPDFPRLAPRTDPKIFPPQNFKIVPVVGPLAYLDPTTGSGMTTEYGGVSKTVDPLDPVPEDEEEVKPKKKAKKPKRNNLLQDDPQGSVYVPPESSPTSGYPGMEGSMVSNVAGKIHPEADRGFRPTSGNAIAKAGQAMVIMAVVPYEKQFEEYEKALSESLEYQPGRDSPQYLLFHVERADVTADPDADPAVAEWVRLNTRAALAEVGLWAGTPAEISDPLYVDPIPGLSNSAGGMSYAPAPQMSPGGDGMSVSLTHQFGVLTHPAPPFMLREIWDLLTHPDVPLMKLATTGSGYPGGPMPGMPGSGMPGAVRLGPDGKPLPVEDDLPGIGLPQQGAMNPNSPYGQYPGEPGRQMGGMPYGESGYGSSGTIDPNVRPQYKLVRFTDTGVEMGRKYRYRLKVFLEDPNYPSARFRSPPPSSLDNEVQDRVKKQMAADAKRPTQPGTTFKTYWRESEWSEPSEVVALPPAERFLAISADPPAVSTIVPDRPGVPSTQPDAKVLTVIWDPTKAADLAAEEEVFRGSTISFVAEAWAVHPVKLEVRSLPDTPFRTSSIVADIQGGETIPAVKRGSDPLKAPAEILIFDAQGNLSVEDETFDIEDIRRFTPVKEEKLVDPMMEGSGYPPGTEYDALMNPPGGPGPGPVRRGSRSRGSVSP